MLDRKYILTHKEQVLNGIGTRSVKLGKEAESIFSLLQNSLENQRALEEKQARLNAASKMQEHDEKKIKELKILSNDVAKHKADVKRSEEVVQQHLNSLPNIPLADVPVGPDASGNTTIRESGTKPSITHAKDYLTLAESLGIIDMPRGAKVSGSRFGYLKGPGALLEFALVQYAMQELTKAVFTAVVPPVIVNEPYMEAMGYLAQGGADEVYHLEKDKQYLVGTSEQSVGPYHADEILPESELPKKYAAFSTCFRREAGSYGKDTKGILRVHQFDKVEMFVVCAPSESEKIHQELLAMQEKLVQGLGIPYRLVQLCTGDLGFPAAKTYDIECWLPGQNSGKGEYRETHSTSNTTDYQARALNIRMKGKDGKNVIAHLLNGTAFAIGRTIVAILENYQQPDGSVKIPEVLVPFMHGITRITKA